MLIFRFQVDTDEATSPLLAHLSRLNLRSEVSSLSEEKGVTPKCHMREINVEMCGKLTVAAVVTI
jgi:hypothetical protein